MINSLTKYLASIFGLDRTDEAWPYMPENQSNSSSPYEDIKPSARKQDNHWLRAYIVKCQDFSWPMPPVTDSVDRIIKMLHWRAWLVHKSTDNVINVAARVWRLTHYKRETSAFFVSYLPLSEQWAICHPTSNMQWILKTREQYLVRYIQ